MSFQMKCLTFYSDGTSPFVGTYYSGRGATFIDSNLRMPYIMSWSGGVQTQMSPTCGLGQGDSAAPDRSRLAPLRSVRQVGNGRQRQVRPRPRTNRSLPVAARKPPCFRAVRVSERFLSFVRSAIPQSGGGTPARLRWFRLHHHALGERPSGFPSS
jgi:hypothetical protein